MWDLTSWPLCSCGRPSTKGRMPFALRWVQLQHNLILRIYTSPIHEQRLAIVASSCNILTCPHISQSLLVSPVFSTFRQTDKVSSLFFVPLLLSSLHLWLATSQTLMKRSIRLRASLHLPTRPRHLLTLRLILVTWNDFSSEFWSLVSVCLNLDPE